MLISTGIWKYVLKQLYIIFGSFHKPKASSSISIDFVLSYLQQSDLNADPVTTLQLQESKNAPFYFLF